MANDTLGIYATINGQDVMKGANEFIAQVSRMQTNSDKFLNHLSQSLVVADGKIQGLSNSFDGIARTIISKMSVIGAAFSAQQFAKQAMSVRGDFQQLEVAFQTMLGSAEKADKLMNQLVNTAAKTPFDLQGVANGAKQLLAYGVASEEVNDTLIRLGDIAAGLSIPLNDLVYLYGTTLTQGRLFTQDLRQFQGRGIPLADELAKQFGVATDKVGELVTAGKVGFPEVQRAIVAMTSEGGKFGGLMDKQSKTISGQISNIQDSITSMFNEIGKQSEGVINSALGSVSFLVENWKSVGEAIGVAATTYGTYKAVLMTTAAVSNMQQDTKTYAEISGYEQLLQKKQEMANADLQEAVMNGRLTQEKAAYIASLRQEVAARLALLETEKSAALAEEASALKAYEAAKQRSEAADDYLEKMMDLYDASLNQGDASYQEYAMQQLQTATQNANTASLELNTAQKNYNAASSKSKAAAEAYDTAATKANTVANAANTASVNIMKAAYKQLLGILKAAYATMMSNPAFLVAGAVTALGYAIYKLATAETETEKAVKEANEEVKQQGEYFDELSKKSKQLVQSMTNTSNSTQDRYLAYTQLKRIYPEILKNMDWEQARLLKQEGLEKKITDELFRRQRIGAQVKMIQSQSKKRDLENQIIIAQNRGLYTGALKEQLKAEGERLKIYTDQYNELKAAQKASTKDDTQKKTKNYDYWENQKKDAEAKLKELDSSKKGSTEWIQYENQIKDAEKQMANYSISEKSEEKLKEQTENYKRLVREQSLEKERADEDAAMAEWQNNINLQKEGADKELEQLELDHERKMMEIDRQREDTISKNIENARKVFEANPINEGKTFDDSGIGLTDAQQSSIDSAYKAEIDAFEKSKEELNRRRELAWADYFIQFGNFKQKEEAIRKTYDSKISKATNEAERASLREELNQAIQDLSIEQLKSTIDWDSVFGDLNKTTEESLVKLREQLSRFIQEQKNLTPENLKDLSEAIEKIDNEISSRNPFDTLSKSLEELALATIEAKRWQEAYNKALQEGNAEDISLAKEQLDAAKARKRASQSTATIALQQSVSEAREYVEAGNQVLGIMETLGIETPEWLSGFMGGMNEVLSGLEHIDLTKPMSIIAGSLQAVKGALVSVVSLGGLIPGLGGADYSSYYKMKEKYDDLIDTWDEIISKKREYINIDYGDEARKAGQEAIDLVAKQAEAYRRLGIDRLNAGASAGSHSIGVRQRRRMGKQEWSELEAAAQTIGIDYSSIESGRMEGLFSLSAEQLQKLKEEAPTFWAKLDDDVKEYLQGIIDCNNEIENMKEKLNETMTGISFDSFYDNFVSTLYDMDKDSQDFADDFGEYLKKSIIANMVANTYRDKIKDLYNQWAAYADSDQNGTFDLTEQEAALLREAQKSLAEQMIKERDAMSDVFGWDNLSSQEASAKGFETMSQNTADELNGRFTALQLSNESIKTILDSHTPLIETIMSDTSQIRSSIALQTQYITEIADIQRESNDHLSAISKNTYQLYQMNERLDKIERNTRNI